MNFDIFDEIIHSNIIKEDRKNWEIQDNYLILKESENINKKDVLKEVKLSNYGEIYKVFKVDGKEIFGFFSNNKKAAKFSKSVDFLVFTKINNVNTLLICELRSKTIKSEEIRYKFIMTDEFIELIKRISNFIDLDISNFKKKYLLFHTCNDETFKKVYKKYKPTTKLRPIDRKIMFYDFNIVSTNCKDNNIYSLEDLK